MSFIIKQKSADFVVEEIAGFFVDDLLTDRKRYSYYCLEKDDISHFFVLKKVAAVLGVSVKDINYSGTKDKKAITIQYISVKGGSQFSGEICAGVKLEFLGYSNSPLSLGSHKANKFTIVVRGLEKGKYGLNEKMLKFVNYFDSQRFSSNNIAIGKALILKDFLGAAKLIDDIQVQECLEKFPSQPLKAVKLLSKKVISLYLHAYQSYLFNETVRMFLSSVIDKKDMVVKEYPFGKLAFLQSLILEKFEDLQVPLPGFLELESTESKINLIQKELLEREGVKVTDFIIKQFSNMSLEGNLRKMFASVEGFKVLPVEDDELNSGKEKVVVSFELGKGSYATMLLKQLIREKN